MKLKPLPSQERIRELLDYDSDTGVFTWLPRSPAKAWKISLDWTQAGSRGPKGIIICVDRVLYSAHRLAWVYVYGDVLDTETHIDHKNCDCYDNRIENLRPATHGQNASNSRGWRKKALPKGVSLMARGKPYRARIGIDGKVVWLGVFDTPEEAHAAYVSAASVAKGEFARAR